MLQKNFLVLYDEDKTAQLLGYPLSLSPLEFDLLYAIADATLIDAPALVERLKGALALTTVPVHVHAINKKAFAISGRKLVAYTAGGYAIYLQM